MSRSRRLFLIAAAALVLVAIAVLLLRRAPAGDTAPVPQAGAAAPAQPALTVQVAAPESAELAVTLAANGNIAAWQEAVVGSEANGLRLAEVLVNVGDRVRKGQPLARFNGDTVAADIAQARAALAEAKAGAAEAGANATRARTLEKTGVLSQQQILQYQTGEQTAGARVQAAEAALSAQQLRDRHTQVLAPDDGIISARNATVGSVVSAGAELFRLIRGGRLEWRAEVGADEVNRIAVGMAATVTAPGGAQVPGKVRSIAPTVDVQTRNALVYVDLPSLLQDKRPGVSAFKTGMFARGEFRLGQSAAQTVPQGAVVPRDGFNTVMVLQPDQRVRQVKVQVGRQLGERVEVSGSLPADARVVVDGAGFLNDGDLVRVVSATAPAAPASAASAPR